MPTPVRPAILAAYLSGYDPALSEYLLSGFRSGFSLQFQGERVESRAVNLKSALENPQLVTTKLGKEIAAGRIIGPITCTPKGFRSSPLGLVPKKEAGEYRLIHHLSYPEGASVNDGIPPEHTFVRYASIQDAISIIKAHQGTMYLAKSDIQSAFRIIPVSPSDYPLLGIEWEGQLYMDRVLAMGCSSSCAIFEKFSTAIEWIAVHKLGIRNMVHVIDDFLIIAESEASCAEYLRRFQKFCGKVGIPLSPEKTFGPATMLPFLGITLDTVALEARLPEDKIEKCRGMIDTMLAKPKVILRELQSLIGLLNFACSIIIAGRAFLRRLIDLTIGHTKPHYHIRITNEVREDLAVWKTFFDGYNCRSFFHDEQWLSSDHIRLFTDASGGLGYGAICGTHWFSGRWPDEWKSLPIATLELFPIMISLRIWAHRWENKKILFMSDNMAVVAIINKQTSKDKNIMSMVRVMVSICLKHNIMFASQHVPGKLNVLADRLSRLQLQEFRQLAPEADPCPTRVPDVTRPENWKIV